ETAHFSLLGCCCLGSCNRLLLLTDSSLPQRIADEKLLDSRADLFKDLALVLSHPHQRKGHGCFLNGQFFFNLLRSQHFSEIATQVVACLERCCKQCHRRIGW